MNRRKLPTIDELVGLELKMKSINPGFTGASGGIVYVDGTPAALVSARVFHGYAPAPAKDAPDLDAIVTCRVCKRTGTINEMVEVRSNRRRQFGFCSTCLERKEAA